MKKITLILSGIVVILLVMIVVVKVQKTNEILAPEPTTEVISKQEKPPVEKPVARLVSDEILAPKILALPPIEVHPIPNYLEQSIQWLAATQAPNGGWGVGAQTDPATSAFCAIALARTGSSIENGIYKDQLQKALDYLLECVAASPENATNITDQTGTQPQRKLGQNIDVSMAIQFFGKIIHEGVSDDDVEQKINDAMDRCIAMLENTQQKDGSWNAGGWAPVLNSAMANNALEMSKALGKDVEEVLDQSQSYQKSNMDLSSGSVKTDKAAGIALYSVTSTQRATAQDATEAEAVFEDEQKANPKISAPKTEQEAYERLKVKYSEKKAKKLAGSYQANVAAKNQLRNDAVLSGFGNNGGEEYLSYMMTSESFVAEGDQKAWDEWHGKMAKLFKKVQNGDGSWTGQHCITSPVFCTAAVVMTLTADRDSDILMAKK